MSHNRTKSHCALQCWGSLGKAPWSYMNPRETLKRLFSSTQDGVCMQSPENSRFREPRLNETSREWMLETAHRAVLTFASWLCKHMREEESMSSVSPEAPRHHLAGLGTHTASLLWGCWEHCPHTQNRVTPANDCICIDFSDKCFPGREQNPDPGLRRRNARSNDKGFKVKMAWRNTTSRRGEPWLIGLAKSGPRY